MNHMMIDVEALRLKKPWLAPLMQVGMVVFDEKGVVKKMVEVYVDQASLPEWAVPEKQTVEFWEKQPGWPKMLEALESRSTSVFDALLQIRNLYTIFQCQSVWFAGPKYDETILDSYFDHFELDPPWRYNDSRDYRTIRKQHPDVPKPDNPNLHFALEDAMYQVAHLRDITQKKGIVWL